MTAHRTVEASRWPTILVISGAGVVSAFQVGKAPAALAAVRADLALDLATASWLLSAFALVGALAGVLVGGGVGQFGARRLAIGGLLLQGLCSFLGGFADDAPLLLASRVVEGLGFLTVTVAAPTLIVAVARPAERGPAIAVWGTFMPVGITLVLLGAPLLTLVGWRGFWLLNAATLVGYAGLLALATRGIAVPGAQRGRIAEDVGRTLGAGGPWLLAGLMTAFGAAYFAVFGFLPTILSERLQVSAELGSLMTAGAVIVNAIGNLACGHLLARGLRRAHLLLFAFLTMALAGFGIFSPDLPGGLAYALCVVFSLIGGLIPVALIDGASRHAPRPELVGATIGFVMQGNNLGLVLGPALSGALAAAFGWPAISMLIAALAGAAVVLTLALPERTMETAPCPDAADA